MDCYVFYDANDEQGSVTYERAAMMARELERIYGVPVHIIDISSNDEFVDAWNGKDNYGLGYDSNGNVVSSIEVVVIFAHGYYNGIAFGEDLFTIKDIDKLDTKNMSLLVLMSCSTADSSKEQNFAGSLFAAQRGIRNMIAAGGVTYIDEIKFPVSKTWYGMRVYDTFVCPYIIEGEFFLYTRDTRRGRTVIKSIGDCHYGFTTFIPSQLKPLKK